MTREKVISLEAHIAKQNRKAREANFKEIEDLLGQYDLNEELQQACALIRELREMYSA